VKKTTYILSLIFVFRQVTGFIFTNDFGPDASIEMEVCARDSVNVAVTELPPRLVFFSSHSSEVDAANCDDGPSCMLLSVIPDVSQCTTTRIYTFTVPSGGGDSLHVGFSDSNPYTLEVTLRDLSSTGGGDPHFKGFHGQKFDFDGVRGHVYILISNCHIQVNTRFTSIRNLTFMGEIGIMTKDHKMLLTPGEYPIMDGEELRESKKYFFSGLSVEVKEDVGHVFVRMEGHYQIKVMYIPWEKYNTGFHNVKVTSFGRKGSGIIGHTWKREIEDDLEGRYRVVDGLFGDKFVENLFGDCEDERNGGDVWIGGAEPPVFA